MLLLELFGTPLEYKKLTQDDDAFHKYFLIVVNDTNYRLNIARASSKGSYIITLGEMNDNGKLVQFQYRGSDFLTLISTVFSIFAEWFESNKNITTSVIFKLPNKIPDQKVKLAERLVKRLKIIQLEKLIVNGVKEAKNKYIFYKNNKKPEDDIVKSLAIKSFEEYSFKDAFSAELLDSLMPKIKGKKSHILVGVEVLAKGYDIEDVSKVISDNTSEKELELIETEAKAIKLFDIKEQEEKFSEKARKEIPKADNPYFHWNKSGNRDRILCINSYLDKRFVAGKKNLDDLFEFLTREPRKEEDKNKEKFPTVELFAEAFNETYLMWDSRNYQESVFVDFMRNAILSIEQDYLKYLEYWDDKDKEFGIYTPYIFWGGKKIATDKSKFIEKQKEAVKTQEKIVPFFVNLINNAKASSVGRILQDSTTIYVMTSTLELRYKELVGFVDTLTDSFDDIELDKITKGTDNIDYYGIDKLSNKAQDKLFKDEVIVVSEIPLLGLQEPKPLNNIFDGKKLAALENSLYELQKSKTSNIEKKAIMDYTGSGYNTINGALRDVSKIKQSPTYIKQFMNEYVGNAIEAPYDLEVSRKTNFPSEFELDKTYVETGAMSTSISSSVWSGTSKLRIKIPKGAKIYIAMKGYSSNSGEKEIILPPGTILKPYRKTIMKNSKQEWIDCLYMGTVFDHVKAIVDAGGEVTQKAESFKHYMKVVTENVLDREEPEKEFDRQDAIVNDTGLFIGSEEMMKLIKSGKVKPKYYVKQKKS